MSRQAVKDTAPELALRRELHSRGLRYRVHFAPLPGLRRTADIAFTRQRIAVFVDGCFWHSCPQHRTSPKANSGWWAEKLAANTTRDLAANVQLIDAGWSVVRVWEHVDPSVAAHHVELLLRQHTRAPGLLILE